MRRGVAAGHCPAAKAPRPGSPVPKRPAGAPVMPVSGTDQPALMLLLLSSGQLAEVRLCSVQGPS